MATKKPGKSPKNGKVLPYTRINVILLILGFVFLVTGYLALATKPWNSFLSLNVAPILLLLGYCVLIPAAILYHKKDVRPVPGAISAQQGEPHS
jgi:carbon starvation protein CstA